MAVVLTGATGFLGSRLLRHLLMSGGDDVIAFVRDDPEPAWDRLTAALKGLGGGDAACSELRSRVRPVRVTLADPMLGLQSRQWRELAGRATSIWHSAASIDLVGRFEDLAPVNVMGTQHILDFAEMSCAPVFYVSTAFVAGRRDQGMVMEDELTDEYGFQVPYERSKYEAELLVRRWSQHCGRPATIFRPSVLVTHEPTGPDVAGHTLSTLADRMSRIAIQESTLRLTGDPDATLNLLQVEYAVQTMALAATAARPQAVTTYHITHPIDTPLRVILDVIEEMRPGLRIHLGAEPATATSTERIISKAFEMFIAYLSKQRQYDRSCLKGAIADLPDPAPIDAAYLRAVLGQPRAAHCHAVEKRDESHV